MEGPSEISLSLYKLNHLLVFKGTITEILGIKHEVRSTYTLKVFWLHIGLTHHLVQSTFQLVHFLSVLSQAVS